MKKTKLIRVTTVLSWVESAWKEWWWRNVGFEEADKISKESAEFGTRVHKIIENDLLELQPLDVITTPEDACAEMILKWIEMNNILPLFNTWKESLEVEVKDNKLGLVGHFDMAGSMGTLPVIIDFKTSNKIRKSFPLQKSAYAVMANKMFNVKINTGITLRSHWNKETQKVEFEEKNYNNLVKTYWPIFKSALVVYKYFNRAEK